MKKLKLSGRDWIKFNKELQNPSKPNEKLKEATKKYTTKHFNIMEAHRELAKRLDEIEKGLRFWSGECMKCYAVTEMWCYYGCPKCVCKE